MLLARRRLSRLDSDAIDMVSHAKERWQHTSKRRRQRRGGPVSQPLQHELAVNVGTVHPLAARREPKLSRIESDLHRCQKLRPVRRHIFAGPV